MTRLNRFLAFDETTGTLTCEGGALLSDIIDVFVPRGWFPPVTPGTQFVTIGGIIASDIHGKNHHVAGSFCEHVASIQLALGDGRILRCSRTENADLFSATCGGMGLTGVILRSTFRLIPIATSWIDQTIIRAANLDCAMEAFEASQGSTYSVAWIDCLASGAALGRSVVILGEHATVDRLIRRDQSALLRRRKPKTKRVPADLPGFILNRVSVGLFNRIYYRVQRPGSAIIDFEPFFYPLDALHDWNRIYGRKGFVQYQCVLPQQASRSGLIELLTNIARAGEGSFLAVLKRLGPKSFGYLSFPMEGYTLALDFPAKPEVFRLLDRLDAIVAAHSGRLYLAKDARTSARMIAAGYPQLDAFREVRVRYDLQRRFQSVQSARLEL